jgi:DNA repair exonuclease SbcCD ATPase subunit
VNLLRCHILGFGKLTNLALSFSSGLNVVTAANEGGKSTLQRFLMALLYGQLRSDVKTQRRLDPWVDQYRPWRGADYGGTLWCSLANGRELEIYRSFGRDESRVEIHTISGEDVTREYETLRNGDVMFAGAHLALTKELFESVAVIRETETAELKHREALRDRIANLAQSGDEKLSVRLSLVKLEEALEAVGSERAPTRPYKQALQRVSELQQEREELETRRRQCQDWIHQRRELEQEIARLEQDMLAAGRGVIDARWREAGLRVHTLDEIDSEISRIRDELGSLNVAPEFPVHRLDDLNRLVADSENSSRRLEEVRLQKQKAEEQRALGDTELRKLAPYEALHATVEPEKITEWFVGYLSLSRQKDEAQRTMARLLDEGDALQNRLDSLSPALQDSETDWERKARQAADEESIASQQSLALAEKISKARTAHARIAGAARSRGWIAGLALLGSLAAGALSLASVLPLAFAVALAGSLALVSLFFWIAASRSASAARLARREFEALEASLKRMGEQVQAIRVELQAAIAASGFVTADEFLAAARQVVLDRQRLEDLVDHVREAERQRNQLQAEAEEVYGHLKDCLSRVSMTCAPGNLKVPVDTLRANMRRYSELKTSRQVLAQQISALQMEEDNVAARAGETDARVREILAEGGVESAGAFRQACQNCRRLHELRARESSRAREFERLRGDLTLEQWKTRLEDLQKLRVGSAEEAGTAAGSSGTHPLLPYQPTVEEAEQEERRTAAILAAKREDFARMVERVRQAFHNYRTPSEIEEDLAGAEQKAAELTLSRKALTLALDEINKLARLQQEVCAPQLNRIVEERFLQICRDRYEEVKIDPDFHIQLREQGTPELRPAENLSRGTQDQIYLAVRFGILELLGNEVEHCPCLLDEPFVAYDRERMCAAFGILEQEAARRQLILFTCREDVRDQALQHGARHISL